MINRFESVEALTADWADNPRWQGVCRDYTASDVTRLRGSVQVEHTLAGLGAEKLWRRLNTEDYVPTLGALTGGQALQQVKASGTLAALTRGERGSVVVSGNDVHEIACEPVEKVVDTTGAGDQFAAGFLHGLTQGRDLAACGRLGSLAAAEIISHYGARPETSLAELARAKGL